MVCMDDEIKRRYKNDIGLETRLGKESLEMFDKNKLGTSLYRDDETIRIHSGRDSIQQS